MDLDILYCKTPLKNLPLCAHDLHLDQIFNAILKNKADFHLEDYFNTPLDSIEAVEKRQAIFKDLEARDFFLRSISFSFEMQRIHNVIDNVRIVDLGILGRGRFMQCIMDYIKVINDYYQILLANELQSTGLIAIRDYIALMLESKEYQQLKADSDAICALFAKIEYDMLLKNGNICFRKPSSKNAFTSSVNKELSSIAPGAKESQIIGDKLLSDLVEMGCLDILEDLFPNEFEQQTSYLKKHNDFFDNELYQASNQLQFYLSYIGFMDSIKDLQVSFCYPMMVKNNMISNAGGYDMALAYQFYRLGGKIVTNDYYLENEEQIFVVSGPNQGGKTTFARAFGQINYFASLGCPVPGTSCKAALIDNVYTHFQVIEDVKTANGKFMEELVRLRAILDVATSNSILIINEIFTSTALKDALEISNYLFDTLFEKKTKALFITFMDELSALNEKVVSMISTVNPQDTSERTFKILRAKADGLAYANAIVAKHQLSYNDVRRRIKK